VVFDDTGGVGIITRIGSAPGLRRLVRKPNAPAVAREDPDEEPRDPRWCADCRREVLFEMDRCRHCGGEAVTANELARRAGNLPRSPGTGAADWRL
jgi:hypothetical protein